MYRAPSIRASCSGWRWWVGLFAAQRPYAPAHNAPAAPRAIEQCTRRPYTATNAAPTRRGEPKPYPRRLAHPLVILPAPDPPTMARHPCRARLRPLDRPSFAPPQRARLISLRLVCAARRLTRLACGRSLLRRSLPAAPLRLFSQAARSFPTPIGRQDRSPTRLRRGPPRPSYVMVSVQSCVKVDNCTLSSVICHQTFADPDQ
jgi:hypothetical protein